MWQTVQKKQEFIAQIMSSKSPVRSCDDVDETALSYAEIKALCAGNPLIAEKMALDNDVAKLRMLKSEHQSQHFRLEDSLLKHFPQQIASVTERIAGIEKDVAAYTAEKEKHTEVTMTNGAASATVKFPGMTINGATHIEKEPAAKALLEATKDIKDIGDELLIGEFMGFKMSLQCRGFTNFFESGKTFTINLLLRGAMTYQVELGTDAFGNITRITNALEKLPERLEGAKTQLENLEKQISAATEELSKPFALEDELKAKEARLALLNADLNIDGEGGLVILNDTEENRDEKAEYVVDADERDGHDEEVDDGEPEQSDRSFDIASTGRMTSYGYDGDMAQSGLQRTGTYGKSAPSILDDVRDIKSELKPPAQGGKSAGIDIG